jgi:FkbM family methyltransferase
MNSERKKIINLFSSRVLKYKDSMQYGKKENNKLKRVLYNFGLFGLSYVYYHLARLRLLNLLGDVQCFLFFGKKMRLPLSDINTGVFAMYGISPHKSERKLALWMMENLAGDEVLYDIGSHMGYYTALFEKMFKNGEAHAFEANKKLCSYLKNNFSNSSNVYIVCAAVADFVGEVDFYDATETEDSSASSRLQLSEEPIPSCKVPSVTLDNYVTKGNSAPTVIKFDIEGGEYDAILGASDTIERNNPIIIMEIWGGDKGKKYSDQSVKKLQELGYKAFFIRNDGSTSDVEVKNPVDYISGGEKDPRDNFLFIKK